MTTVINNPGEDRSGDSGFGIIIGVIVAILLVTLFLAYGLPAIRMSQEKQPSDTTNINVTIPNPTTQETTQKTN